MSLAANDVFYLGLDGGGSKCQARIADAEGVVLGEAVAGPANPLHGLEQTLESIEQAASRALAESGRDDLALQQLVAGVGLAGVNLPSLFQAISAWQHPFAALYLTTDLHIACLGAHQRDDGAVIVVGTGSCGYVGVAGHECILGGHGFPLGDKGSGAWMGLEAAKAVLLASDGLGPETRLEALLSTELKASGLMVVERLSNAKSSDYARLAPLVLRAAQAGDRVAERIVREGADYISAMGQKLLAYHPSRISMIGGLAEPLRPWLAPRLADRLSAPLGPPEAGALLHARRHYQAAQAAQIQ